MGKKRETRLYPRREVPVSARLSAHIEKVYTQIDDDHLVRAIAQIPAWKWHKTATSEKAQKNRLRFGITQPFDS